MSTRIERGVLLVIWSTPEASSIFNGVRERERAGCHGLKTVKVPAMHSSQMDRRALEAVIKDGTRGIFLLKE
jgi:hypothetical protein